MHWHASDTDAPLASSTARAEYSHGLSLAPTTDKYDKYWVRVETTPPLRPPPPLRLPQKTEASKVSAQGETLYLRRTARRRTRYERASSGRVLHIFCVVVCVPALCPVPLYLACSLFAMLQFVSPPDGYSPISYFRMYLRSVPAA